MSNGSVVVFDKESDSQNSHVIAQLGADLSRTLDCPVLAVINHDDVLIYQLFERGARIDRYCSAPGYFSGEDLPASGGDARKLCTAFAASTVDEVETILHPTDDDRPAFAIEQHEALVRAIGTPDYAVGGSFTYISRGELPAGLNEGDLIESR